MALRFFRYRWRRVSAIVLLTITIVIFIVALLVNRYWSPILAENVRKAVEKSSDGLYKVSFSSADFHVLRGSIVFNNIVFKPDTAVYNNRKKQHLAPNTLVELYVKQLTFANIHPITLYWRNKLEVGKIIFKEPRFNVSYQLNHTKDTIVKDNRTPWQKISNTLHSIHINNIILDNVKFRYEDYSGVKLEVSELKELNISAHDLLIDSATQTDKRRLFYCRDIVTDLNNYSGKTVSGLYNYTIKSLNLSTEQSRLTIIGFKLKPVLSVASFEKIRKDRLTFNMDTIQLNNFDFLNYYKYRSITGSSLLLSNGAISIFSDPNGKKASSADRINTFPNIMLKKFTTALKLDTVNIRAINAEYSELNSPSQKIGTLTFNKMRGRILNVSNDADKAFKNNTATANLSAYFMNRGRLDVMFTFDLSNELAGFTCKGRLGIMNLQLVNPAVMPLAMVKIRSGIVKSFTFDILGDRNGAKGKVSLLYNNLSVTILKPDTANDRFKRMTIASLFANNFILKHDNPDGPGALPRTFDVRYQRQPDASFFKTVWQTLLEGIKPSAGFDEKTEQNSRQRMKDAAVKKVQRKIKRAKRIQRRAERRREQAIKRSFIMR